MSSVMRPVGPEPPSTYWLRRAGLIAVLVVVIVLIAYACSAGGGSGTSGKQTLRSTTNPATTPTTTAAPTSPTPAATKPASSCGGQLTAAVQTDQRDYRVGATPKLTATLSNTGSHACTLVSGQSRQIWTITSGHDHVWSTKGCTGTATTKITIKAHGEHVVSTIWNGRRTDSGCAVGQPATAGTYVLSATIDGVDATPVVFRLT